jgi:hypothetical protein
VVLAASATCAGSERGDFAGTWVMRIGDRNLFVLTLTPEVDVLRGTFERPAALSSSGGGFANMSGEVRRDPVVVARVKDGALHFTTQNANDPKDQDAYAMTVKGDQAELVFDDAPQGVVMQPYSFERASGEGGQ